MGVFGRLFGKPDPTDVFTMPDNPADFVAELSRRKFWRDIGKHLLNDIARNADGDMELLRNFVFVSEHYELVGKNFVRFATDQDKTLGTPVSGFALTLYRLGSTLCKQSVYIGDPEQQEFALMTADMAFTSAVLCDPLFLAGYMGMAFLYGNISFNKKVALEWCQKYKDAEETLLRTPDERLSLAQRSWKWLVEDPEEAGKICAEIAMRSPRLLDARGPADKRPMREVIKELEERLLAS